LVGVMRNAPLRKGFALPVFGGKERLAGEGPLNSDGLIVPGDAAFVFRLIVASRVTCPLVEAFEEETWSSLNTFGSSRMTSGMASGAVFIRILFL
jgi:hypothetical protein